MSIKDMQCVTVEQVHLLRQEAIVIEAELALTKQKLEAAQLHINELREALEIASDYLPQHWDMLSSPLNKIEQALVKQPDTRALDKALLEAEISGLRHGVHRSFTDTKDRLEELKAKLAELNKDIPE